MGLPQYHGGARGLLVHRGLSPQPWLRPCNRVVMVDNVVHLACCDARSVDAVVQCRSARVLEVPTLDHCVVLGGRVAPA